MLKAPSILTAEFMKYFLLKFGVGKVRQVETNITNFIERFEGYIRKFQERPYFLMNHNHSYVTLKRQHYLRLAVMLLKYVHRETAEYDQ